MLDPWIACKKINKTLSTTETPTVLMYTWYSVHKQELHYMILFYWAYWLDVFLIVSHTEDLYKWKSDL